ncbi:MAG: hypothetical protein FWE20_08590 [Defluviitaleaceae bacterium]|nr:hypothetical protein [Defluviitaleaceae bacterium]
MAATISGRLIFDRDRTGVASDALPGIAGIPIVLQKIDTGERIAVYTDTNGGYFFDHVKNGDYRIVQAYGEPAVPTPGNFQNAVPGPIPQSAMPSISDVSAPPPGSTHLDCLQPSIRFANIPNGSTNLVVNFLNGPVRYTPITEIIDDGVVISSDNLIVEANGGTFGEFQAGTASDSGAPTNPYPGVGTDFVYVLPTGPETPAPNDGEFTLQNIMSNSFANVSGSWWRIADRSTGRETGRLIVVSGNETGDVFFTGKIAVKPNTYYLLCAWMMNMSKIAQTADQKIGARILDQHGSVMYEEELGEPISANPNTPEWKQVGTVIHSRDNTSLSVELISIGAAGWDSACAADNIEFLEVEVPVYLPVKLASADAVEVGGIVKYTVTLFDPADNPLAEPFFRDTLPDGLAFVPGSVTVNGASYPAADPGTGFALPDIPGGEALTVVFSAKADHVPAQNPAVNSAEITYSYSPVRGGFLSAYDVRSNEVYTEIRGGQEDPRYQAVTDIIQSVALQETALAHILNAEGKKIQAITGTENTTTEHMLKLNRSASSLVNTVTILESTLKAKLEAIL